jgi:molybdopterin adenylyltransferase
VKAAVLTVSDGVSAGERDDASGDLLAGLLAAEGYDVERRIVPDDREAIADAIVELAEDAPLVLTTGGTGLGPRDVTPEATQAIADKMIPGFAEEMRRKGLEKTPRAILSRSSAAIRGTTLILNFPGSPKGAVESLDAIAPLIVHSIQIIHGARHD